MTKKTTPLLAVLLVSAACGGSPAEVDLAHSCAAIVGGHPDQRYDPVAALLDASGRTYCTATLIGTSGDDSMLLSAAHCLDAPITHAAFGAQLNAASHYELVVAIEHPDFARLTGEFDFALLLTKGRPPGVVPMPVTTPEEDVLMRGTFVEFVGYGDTETDAASTSQRQAVDGVIDTLTSTTFEYQQSSGGPCEGDSGGPAIALIGGKPRIVGVTSFGDGNGCRSRGVSGRVSAASSFLRDYLDHRTSCPP